MLLDTENVTETDNLKYRCFLGTGTIFNTLNGLFEIGAGTDNQILFFRYRQNLFIPKMVIKI